MSFQTISSKFKLPWVLPGIVIAVTLSVVVLRLESDALHRFAHLIDASVASVVNAFDYRIIGFLNRFAHRSWTFDRAFYLIDSNSLATAPLLVAFWWAWFRTGEKVDQDREFLLFGIIGSFLAVFVARMLAISLPFRERPLRNPLLHFQLPYNVQPERLLGWSSFPSDHGAVWFALATGMYLVSRRVGTAMFVYVCLTLAVARIYLGIHYPSDILAGGLIGIAVVSLATSETIRTHVTQRALVWMRIYPQWFYAALFLVTYQMTDGFISLHETTEFLRVCMTAIKKLI
jgi:undecaprenyl-diphosphatase